MLALSGTAALLPLAATENPRPGGAAAVGVLVVAAYSALVTITPTSLGVDLEPECRAAQEAIGVFTFVFKVVLRCAPLLFAAVAIPIYVYLLLLLYYITLDVISAIVSLPGKLDLIAERMSKSEQA